MPVMRGRKAVRAAVVVCSAVWGLAWAFSAARSPLVETAVAQSQPSLAENLDGPLLAVLRAAGLTGNVESTLQTRLGRPLDPRRIELGRSLFFDNVLGLHEDNSCAGCHSPAAGFGDSQSIAIGIQSNGLVGLNRRGARNQRRTPSVLNTAFFPRLMWNGRFAAKSGDPFDNSLGFAFPSPEGDALKFGPRNPAVPTLLTAQAHIPPTELVEMAGFRGVSTNQFFKASPHLFQFDDLRGTRLPVDASGASQFWDVGFLNEEIRGLVLSKVGGNRTYFARFVEAFGQAPVVGFRVTFPMIAQAITEFEMSLTFANAPVDRFVRGEAGAMTAAQKRGALLFFGKAGCATCHAVGRDQMFSDFQNHVLGVPQLAPAFGRELGNVVFDGPLKNEDFGAEQASGNPQDRYAFRTSPLRNVAVQPTFFHNGAFTRLEDAIRHHLDVAASARAYDPLAAGVAADLAQRRVDMEAVLSRLDPLVQRPTVLAADEFLDLTDFVRNGLLDPRATRANTCRLVPTSVPSGLPVVVVQGCP